MNNREFDTFLHAKLEAIKWVLGSKAEEYATDSDRMHNFVVAAMLTKGQTPAQAAWGMAKKHLVSVMDLIAQDGEKTHDTAMLSEKFGDLVNYLILIEAMLNEKAISQTEKLPTAKADSFLDDVRLRVRGA